MSKVWEQAARGDVPLVVAAFITHAAFAMFEDIESRLTVVCNGSNPETLQAKMGCLQNHQGDSPDSPRSSHVDTLQSVWAIVVQFVGSQTRRPARCTGPKQSSIMVRKGPSSAAMDRECYTILLENVRHQGRRDRLTNIVLNGSPLYADIGYLLTHDERTTNGLRCSYGLQFLLETYKSYLLAPNCTLAPSICRLQALKFAQEVRNSIKPVLADSSMPCRFCQTLAFHLENFQTDLQVFMSEKVFDLYFQNPWVSGSHVLEMLEMSFYYGLRLFSYRHSVGSILHVYNILRRLTGFHCIPVLEKLGEVFGEIVFPGGSPDQNSGSAA